MANKAYVGVDNIARAIKGGYVGINGVARKIVKAYVGVDGVAKLCWASGNPVFAENTWDEIIAACQSGSVPNSWKVGDSKPMTINGTEYTIDIIGKNHDEYADGTGKAPLTFQMHECYATRFAMNSSNTNEGGWTSCTMRAGWTKNILAVMPEEVKSAVKEVNKLTSSGGRSTTISTTADKLFLLSEIEVFGAVQYSFNGEGTQYAYYAAGNDKTKPLITEAGIRATKWWCRSPYTANHASFAHVSDTGVPSYVTATSTYGVAAAFCF